MPFLFPHPVPMPALPSATYALPASVTTPAPTGLIYSHTTSAGPDDSFFIAGAELGKDIRLWGPAGAVLTPAVPITTPDHLVATIPEGAADGLYVGVVGENGRWTPPFRLNAPQPWWCTPNRADPGETIDLCGDELAVRPDRVHARVYVAKPGRPGAWAVTQSVSRYRVAFAAPQTPGTYNVWVYAGSGGEYGWGGPLSLQVQAPRPASRFHLRLADTNAGIQSALDRAGAAGGGVVELAAGTYPLKQSLVVPSDVKLQGSSETGTILKLEAQPGARLIHPGDSGWDKIVGGLQVAGTFLTYRIHVPTTGRWTVWTRYAADNAGYGLSDMGEHSTLQVDAGAPIPLQNLPNTGGWNTLRWSRSAELNLSKGPHTLRWTNEKGGGINLDAFVLSRDPAWQPDNPAAIHPSPNRIVIQAEDVTGFRGDAVQFPGGSAAVIWLAGNRAALNNLTILGSPLVNTGIGIRRLNDTAPVDGCRVEAVRVADIGGKFNENSAVRVTGARYLTLRGCDLEGRAPLYFEGMTQSHVQHNWLHSVTRFGGNAEAAIQGRTHALHQNIIEDNVVDSPDAAGGPTARRLLWFSTGLGSVSDNYIARNLGRTRFGGVAGTDQNVGETILFETNMRVAYYGHPETAGSTSVTLPAQGPFWPPAAGSAEEAPQDEYYLYVVRGKGLGQVRRIVGRRDRSLELDHPWNVPPDAGSLLLEALSFAHNIVVGNQLPDGMSGLQLWIGGYRNIFADNLVENERKQGVYLFGAMSTADATMPNHWNAGIGPLFYNSVEGNRIRQTEQGILLGMGDDPQAARGADWPRALGTVIRHNTLVESRTAGVEISAGDPIAGDPNDLAIEGTLVEFNVVRDAPVAYRVGPRTLATLFRRNHAYFWNPMSASPPAAFATTGAREVIRSENTVEGRGGNEIP